MTGGMRFCAKWAATGNANARAHHLAGQAPFCCKKAANRSTCQSTITLTFIGLILYHLAASFSHVENRPRRSTMDLVRNAVLRSAQRSLLFLDALELAFNLYHDRCRTSWLYSMSITESPTLKGFPPPKSHDKRTNRTFSFDSTQV